MLGFETREFNVEVAVQSFVICREQFDTKRWLGSKLQTLYRKSVALNLSKIYGRQGYIDQICEEGR